MDIFELTKKANNDDFRQVMMNNKIELKNLNKQDNKGHTPLFYAITMGHSQMAKCLIKIGAKLKEEHGNPFLLACAEDQLETAKQLYSKSLLNSRDNDENTPLILASKGGHTAVVNWLVNKKADINALNNEGNTAFYQALRFNHPDTAKLLLKSKGLDTQTVNILGYTPLVMAVVKGYLQIARALYTPETDTNQKYTENNTLLHMCAMNGNLKSARWLIQRDADPRVKNSKNLSPLSIAAFNGHTEIVSLLINPPHNKHHKRSDIAQAIYATTYKGNSNIMSMLLHKKHHFSNLFKKLVLLNSVIHVNWSTAKIILNMKSSNQNKLANFHYKYPALSFNNGETLLHAAAQKGHLLMVQKLLKKGADIESLDKNKNTVLHAAVAGGNIELVRYVCQQKINVNAHNKQGKTALHLAVSQKNQTMIQCLLMYGASIYTKDLQNESPKSLAEHHSCIKNCIKEYQSRNFHKFGFDLIHEAVANGEDKSLLQILPKVGNINKECRDGLSATKLSAHMGNIRSLATMLVWQTKGDKMLAHTLGNALLNTFHKKSRAYHTTQKAINVIRQYPENRLIGIQQWYKKHENKPHGFFETKHKEKSTLVVDNRELTKMRL